MQNFDNIKDLWQKTPADLPSSKEILAEVEKTRKKMIRKNAAGIAALCATFAFITWIGFHYEFAMITTRLGIILTLIAIVMGVIFMGDLFKLLVQKADGTLDNTAYLEQLKKIRSKQVTIRSKGITAYFILLTAGIMLYMLEFAVRDLVFGIISYAITLAWIAFSWFYLRKRTAAKQEKQITDQIERIEKLIKDINN
ncbi:MAG: hypothetical protein ACJ77K_06985 [Bacteroidia bacterium]